jgi:hypothetical protein
MTLTLPTFTDNGKLRAAQLRQLTDAIRTVEASAAAVTQTNAQTWDLLPLATSLLSTDGVLIGRAGQIVARAMVPDFITALAPLLFTQLGINQASLYGLVVTGVSVSGSTATVTGKYLDNNFHAGVHYSLDGGTVYTVPATADLTVNPSGTGGTFTLAVKNLTGKVWRLKLRLAASNSTTAETDYFSVGTASTIAFPVSPTLMAGTLTTVNGIMGQASSYIQGTFPALSSRSFGVYNGTTISAGAKWNGNQAFQVPAVAGTYLLRIQNSAEIYNGSPYVPSDASLVVTPALIPALWMEGVPSTGYGAGPYTFVGQWGYSKPPIIQYRVSGGNNGIDSGWVDAGATINNDGSISAVLPKFNTTTTFVMPANNSWTSIQWRRPDFGVMTPLLAMLP